MTWRMASARRPATRAGRAARRCAAILAVALVGVATAGPAAAAEAGGATDGASTPQAVPAPVPTTTGLGLTTFADVTVDPSTGRVLVSGSDQVVVLEPDGTVVASIPVPGAGGMAVDGTDLWVTGVGAGRVSVIDLTTLSIRRSYVVGTLVADSVAVVDGAVWFPGNTYSYRNDLLRLDPVTGQVANLGGAVYGGTVAPIPDIDTHVLFHDRGLSPYSIYRTDITGPTVVLEADVAHGQGSNLRQVVVTEQQSFVAASGAPYSFMEFCVDDMAPSGVVYSATNYPSGIAYTAGGGRLFAGTTASTHQAFVYRPGYPTPVMTASVGAPISYGGVELAPDGTALYVVVEDGPELALLIYALDDVLSSTPPGLHSVCAPGFTDVPPTHPFHADIEWLAAQGLTTGYWDGTFRPGNLVTRQALAAMLYRAEGEPDVGSPGFADVDDGHPFAAPIAWLAEEGLSTGYADGTFRPGADVTRQAFAALLHRMAGEPAAGGATSFSDVGPGHVFGEAIAWLASTGITTGYADGTFRPSDPVSRQALAAFLHRFAELA